MQNDAQRLAQTEQTWLDAVEREKAKVDAALQLPNRLLSDAELAGALATLQQAASWYASLTATAQGLANAGYGRLAQRVSFLLGDAQKAAGIVQEMIQSRVATNKTIADIQRKSADDTLAALQDMNASQQAAFDAMNQQWRDMFNR